MAYTQLHPGLVSRQYGSFTNRASGPPPGAPVTQLHPGLVSRRYGSFAGRQSYTPPGYHFLSEYGTLSPLVYM